MRKCDFDERQLYIRGNIFKHMTITFAVLLLCNAFLMSNGIVWANAFYSNVIIVLIVTAIGSNEMIFREVYVSKNGGQNILIGLIGIVSCIGIIYNIRKISQGSQIISMHRLTDYGGSLVIQLLLFCIFVGYMIKFVLKKHEKQED